MCFRLSVRSDELKSNLKKDLEMFHIIQPFLIPFHTTQFDDFVMFSKIFKRIYFRLNPETMLQKGTILQNVHSYFIISSISGFSPDERNRIMRDVVHKLYLFLSPQYTHRGSMMYPGQSCSPEYSFLSQHLNTLKKLLNSFVQFVNNVITCRRARPKR